MTRFVSPALALLILAVATPVAAQEDPPETVDCPDFSSPDEEGRCVCDDGYEMHDPTFTCLLAPCPENTERAPGRERDPKGCLCLPGFRWEPRPEDLPEEEEFEPSKCIAKEDCDEPGAVRNNDDECICPENATGEFFTDDDGVITLLSCECDEGYLFSDDFYTCRATEEQCPENSHPDPGIPSGDEDGEDLDGITGDCRCDDGYVWTRAEEACTLIISDCGPNAHPSPQGNACECDEGFFPAPQGQIGCIGEEACGRCVAHAHPKGVVAEGEGEGEAPDTCECECNTGYKPTMEGDKLVQCTLIDVPPICPGPHCPDNPDEPHEGEGETTGGGDDGCFGSVAAGVDRPSDGVPASGLLLLALGLGLALIPRRKF